nr:aminopeptidase [Deltaproteobacteria bacterium]
MKHLLATLVVLFAACGDDSGSDPYIPPDPPTDAADVVAKLEAIPGVTATIEPTETAGYSYIVVHFTQPVDHANPEGATFQQLASLLYRSGTAPVVVQTSGYWDYYLDRTVELTRLLSANQISIEHRFFGESRPEPADWSKLTIRQMADDQHAIIAALRSVFPGKVVTTGGSKGGMTAVYHRRFYPDDVDGSVPYVAPLSFAAPDVRYAAFLDTLGPAACRQALRDVATNMLSQRRAAMLDRAQTESLQDGLQYTRIQIGPAVEGSIAGIEWAFWQYVGIDGCDGVPPVTATDDEMWAFLQAVAPVSDNSDASVAQFDAYYYQAYAQLGYPDGGATYLDSFLMYG